MKETLTDSQSCAGHRNMNLDNASAQNEILVQNQSRFVRVAFLNQLTVTLLRFPKWGSSTGSDQELFQFVRAEWEEALITAYKCLH